MKVLTILGARPQFIKAGTLSRSLSNHPDIKEIIVHTGQHYDHNMSDVFFKEMNIPLPKYRLDEGGGSHAQMTGKILIELEKILIDEQPDWVIVYGDTNSTLAGALASSKLNIKIAHIEAGLRSYNNEMPEEINRIVTDRLSTILFCPSMESINNLHKEGFKNYNCKLVCVGDIMKEGISYYATKSISPVNFKTPSSSFHLMTLHRAENTDNPVKLKSIFEALEEIAEKNRIILPIHPRTKKRLEENNIKLKKIEIIPPVGYREMIWLISNADTVITDSGGLQKEAYFLSKHCITLREETEWKELVVNNFNILVGANPEKIKRAFNKHLFNSDFSIELYGDNNVSEKIIKELKDNYT
jgi:UDP-GlcNAc3NAcA epimerase